jgi:hypothetical protein
MKFWWGLGGARPLDIPGHSTFSYVSENIDREKKQLTDPNALM